MARASGAIPAIRTASSHAVSVSSARGTTFCAEPDPQRGLGVHPFPREHHQLGPVPPDHRGRAQHPEPGDQPDGALRHPERRVVRGDHDVAGQGQLAAAAAARSR